MSDVRFALKIMLLGLLVTLVGGDRVYAGVLTTTTISSSTTTTVSSTTTTTTPLCVIDGCRRSVVPFKGKLVLTDPSNPEAGYRVRWKWAAGEATTSDDLYPFLFSGWSSFCLGSATTGTILAGDEFWPPAGWSSVSNGIKWRLDGAGGNPFCSAKKAVLRIGEDGQARVIVKTGVSPIAPLLPLSLPIVVRFALPNGNCWGEYFDAAGVVTNTEIKFVGEPGLP